MEASSIRNVLDGGPNGNDGLPNGIIRDANINGPSHRTVKGSHELKMRGVHYDCLQDDKLEPLAVVGFSLKFPQEATTPEAFWKMLTDKRCAVTEWPKDRLNIDAFYNPDSSRPDTVEYFFSIQASMLSVTVDTV